MSQNTSSYLCFIFLFRYILHGGDVHEYIRSKIVAVFDYISDRFLNVYLSSQVLSVSKPYKCGLRIYYVADAAVGYLLKVIPYFGKSTAD